MHSEIDKESKYTLEQRNEQENSIIDATSHCNKHWVLKKIEYIVLCALIIGWLVLISVFYMYKNQYDIIQELNVTPGKVTCYIDTMTEDSTHYYVDGWAAILGESVSTYNISLIVWDEEEQKGIVFPAKRAERNDVTEFFNDGKNYDNSGFRVAIRKSLLEDKEYQIVIWYQNNDNDIFHMTGRSITYED